MSRPSRIIAHIVAVLVVAVLIAPHQLPDVSAGHSAIGVGPATLEFTDPPLLAGGTKVGLLMFQQHYDRPVQVQIDAVQQSGPAGDATSWIRLSHQGTLTMDPGTHRIDVHVDVPQSAANGHYTTGVRFNVQPPGGKDFEGSGATAVAAVTSILKVDVQNDHEVKRVEAQPQVDVHPAEVDGALEFTLTLSNTGNVDANPNVKLDVSDRMNAGVLQTTWFNDTVLGPGESMPLTFVVPAHALPEGQYLASVAVYLDGTRTYDSGAKEFHVLEKGALLRSLQLQTIRVEDNMTRVVTGQLIKLTAFTANTGQIVAVGHFVGEVRRNGELVEALESLPLEIATGETGQLHMLYKPTEPGSYEFVGRVHYGSKVTEEKSVLLAVEEEKGQPVLLYLGAFGILACAVGVAVVRTRLGK